MKLLLSSNLSHVSQACEEYGLTEAQFHSLHSHSRAAKDNAYCPYSRFHVGASILTLDGQYVIGANVENAAYPVGTCAERVAFGAAITAGHRKFKAVAVTTDISPPASPCGMCRQFIREFCDLQAPILMFDKDGAFVIMTIEQLLPVSFGPEALPPPTSRPASTTS